MNLGLSLIPGKSTVSILSVGLLERNNKRSSKKGLSLLSLLEKDPLRLLSIISPDEMSDYPEI